MFVDPREAMLERLLLDAGISQGMRVLDLGSGHGRVSTMLARIVGPTGAVVGVDRDPDAIAVARSNAARDRLDHVRYQQLDLAALATATLGDAFDAAVARRVFMYVADPVAALRAAKTQVRRGGVIVVQEQDTSMVPVASAPLPLHHQVHNWVWTMVEREGANTRFGLSLPSVFAQSDVALRELRVESVLQTHARRLATADTIRAVMHRIIARGVATKSEIDIDTLDQRLERELVETGASFVGDAVFGAWGLVD